MTFVQEDAVSSSIKHMETPSNFLNMRENALLQKVTKETAHFGHNCQKAAFSKGNWMQLQNYEPKECQKNGFRFILPRRVSFLR